jgi:hypothetical protein
VNAVIDEAKHFLEATSSRRDELREKMDVAAARLAARTTLASAVGTDDGSIIDRLEQLGFTGESAKVIDLLPLIHVAWSDGRIQKGERATILAIVESRGIAPSSEACLLVEALLERRPSETFLAESLALLRDLSRASGRDASDVVDLCATVAESSGRLLGFGAGISRDERALVEHIATALGDAALEKFRARFGP